MEPSHSRRTWIRAGLHGALVLALALWLRGDALHGGLAILVGLTVWPLSGALWALGTWLAGRAENPRTQSVDHETAMFFRGVFRLASCFLASLVVGIVVREYDVWSAKRWCDGHVVDIERFRGDHGCYPTTIAEFDDSLWRPQLVHDGTLHFSSSDGAFRFEMWTGMFSGWEWNSHDREWTTFRFY